MIKILTLIIVGISAAFSSQDRFLDQEKGVQSLAFSGGGYAEVSGVNCLFSNPAGLRIQMGHQLQAGVLNIARGFSPVLAFGQNISELNSYSVGLFRDDSRGEDSLHQGVMGGFTLSPSSFFSLGTVVFTQAVDNEFGVDINAGIQYMNADWMVIGMAIKNINESAIGGRDTGFSPERIYTMGLSLFPKHRLSVFYDASARRVLFQDAGHIFAVKGKIGRYDNVTMINSYKLETEDEMEITMGVGVRLRFRRGRNLYGLDYSIAGFPLGSSSADIVQGFSVFLNFSLYSDKTSPVISVKENKGLIKPSAAPEVRYVYFKLFAEDNESDVKEWHFVICNKGPMGEPGEIRRSYSGKGLPPKTIKWDGRDSYKNLLESGFYLYKLVVTDVAGNLTETRWQMIEVGE
ncbi:hypothetical protein ACFL5V_04100 [Fibrobacterota bacterium]